MNFLKYIAFNRLGETTKKINKQHRTKIEVMVTLIEMKPQWQKINPNYWGGWSRKINSSRLACATDAVQGKLGQLHETISRK